MGKIRELGKNRREEIREIERERKKKGVKEIRRIKCNFVILSYTRVPVITNSNNLTLANS